ncbi:ubiquitin fusion degradation protein (Ufd1) [Apiospora phragmitis]|uniref:Ubiquitin fusion degradation protein (Ufd1) n=1 Tax=Apiospora phragmitis TaxID=2905665 RepID=A0ABR1W945_9PEZI
MALEALDQNTRALSGSSESSSPLADFLSNTLVLRQTVPYLPISALLNLTAASKQLRDLLYSDPDVFRHLDLTHVKAAQFEVAGVDRGGEVWRNVQLDEYLTEDDFYSGPLRGIFSSLQRQHLFQGVQTLCLDGLSVTAELVHDILVDPQSAVRILSLRETKHLNHRKLMQSLRYACRRSRPEDTPRLKGLYLFSKRDAPVLAAPLSQQAPATANVGANWNHKSAHALKEAIDKDDEEGGDDWYHKKGRVISKPVGAGWAETVLDCRGSILFDAVLCTGPRHRNSPAFATAPITGDTPTHPWSVATYSVGGCASCGAAPEGFTTYGESPAEELPLLAPLATDSSNVRAATRPQGRSKASPKQQQQFVPRCEDCIRERYCFACDQWWCEACYQVPGKEELMGVQVVALDDETNGLAAHEAAALEKPKVKGQRKIKKDCWECENNCMECIASTQRHCKRCGGGYCLIHHEGSTMTLCDFGIGMFDEFTELDE